MLTIQEFQEKGYKQYYGSSKKVYRHSHIEKLLEMHRDMQYLIETFTRTKLVPCNQEFRLKKAIPAYNSTVIRLKLKYPNIENFHRFKLIESCN
jgi:hypothetical protein